jgi:hypothetical protein
VVSSRNGNKEFSPFPRGSFSPSPPHPHGPTWGISPHGSLCPWMKALVAGAQSGGRRWGEGQWMKTLMLRVHVDVSMAVLGSWFVSAYWCLDDRLMDQCQGGEPLMKQSTCGGMIEPWGAQFSYLLFLPPLLSFFSLLCRGASWDSSSPPPAESGRGEMELGLKDVARYWQSGRSNEQRGGAGRRVSAM